MADAHRGRQLRARGRLRATVKVEGSAGPRRDPLVHLTVRVQFFAGTAAVRVAVTIANHRRARHPGGIWELGDPGSVHLCDASIGFALRTSTLAAQCSIGPAHEMEPFERWLRIRQHSSGAFTVASHGSTREGRRATPAVLADDVAGRIGLAVDYFWQNCPREIEVQPRACTFRMFPRQPGEIYELQGGERKTHRFTLIFGDDPAARDAVFWGRDAAIAAAAPGWYCAVIGPRAPLGVERKPRHALRAPGLRRRSRAPHSFERKRDVIDEYGWRDFGDIYADHENAFSGAGPADRLALQQPVRRGRRLRRAVHAHAATRAGGARWTSWRGTSPTSTSTTPIATSRPTTTGCSGTRITTSTAGRCTHRSYPAHPKVCGGGPANEHNYAAGLAPALAADRRRRVADDGDRPRRMGHRDGRRPPDRPALARPVADGTGQRDAFARLPRAGTRRRPLDHGARWTDTG